MAEINKSTKVGTLIEKLKRQSSVKDPDYGFFSLYSIELDPDTKIKSIIKGTYPTLEYKYGNQEDADDADVAQVDCDENGNMFYVKFSKDFPDYGKHLSKMFFAFDSEEEADLFIRLVWAGIS